MPRLVGGAGMQNGLVTHPYVGLNIRKDILAAEEPTEEQGGPAPH